MDMGGGEEGGLENHVIALSNALAKTHEVHIIAHPRYTDQFNNVQVHPLDLTRGRRNLFLLFQIHKTINTIKPDIIHAHASKAAALISRLNKFLPKKSKRVATLHSFKRNLTSFHSFDWVIGVSQSVLDALDKPSKSVIYNGLEISKNRIKNRDYLFKLLNISRDKSNNLKLVVAVGRLVPVKRFDILIKAFEGLKNAHLIIVGEGLERTKLESMISAMGQDNIHLIGDRSDNIEIISAADLCVISSEREGFSYVMAEALLSSTPVLSTDVADMRVILPEKAVVPVNNPEVLHASIRDSLEHYNNYLNTYQKTFQWAQQNLSFDQMVANTEQIYRDVIKR